MTLTTTITCILCIMAVIGIATIVYFYLKESTLDEIRVDVYQLILEAEHMYKETGQGKQKFKWVVSQARLLLPKWIMFFITEETLEQIIEIWFQGVKDLLDDGKYNKSAEGE